MIANLSSFDCETNSPNPYQGKCKANSGENMSTDIRVQAQLFEGRLALTQG